jgi:hypothetical protein
MRMINTDLELSRRMFVTTGLAGGLAFVVQPASAMDQSRGLQMEVMISANREVVTLINVFVVAPEIKRD